MSLTLNEGSNQSTSVTTEKPKTRAESSTTASTQDLSNPTPTESTNQSSFAVILVIVYVSLIPIIICLLFIKPILRRITRQDINYMNHIFYD